MGPARLLFLEQGMGQRTLIGFPYNPSYDLLCYIQCVVIQCVRLNSRWCSRCQVLDSRYISSNASPNKTRVAALKPTAWRYGAIVNPYRRGRPRSWRLARRSRTYPWCSGALDRWYAVVGCHKQFLVDRKVGLTVSISSPPSRRRTAV